MWCSACHYGSPYTKLTKCPMCGCIKFITANPTPKKPVRSIRAMGKRIETKEVIKGKKNVSEDVGQIMKQASSRQ